MKLSEARKYVRKYRKITASDGRDPYYSVTIMVVWHRTVWATGYAICNTVDTWDVEEGHKQALKRAIADAARQIVQLAWHEEAAKRAEARKAAEVEGAKDFPAWWQQRLAEAVRMAREQRMATAIAREDAKHAAEATQTEPFTLRNDSFTIGIDPAKLNAEETVGRLVLHNDSGRVSGDFIRAGAGGTEPASPFSPDDPLVSIEGKLDRLIAAIDRMSAGPAQWWSKRMP